MPKLTDRNRLVKMLGEVKNVKLDDGWDGNTILARMKEKDPSNLSGDVIFTFDDDGKLISLSIAEGGPT